jgi:putative ABC transport system substrate-binding protein
MLFLRRSVRDIALALALTILWVPYSGWAQQPAKVWRVGFLSSSSGPTELVEAFRDQLRILGYVEGRNLSIEYRWAGEKDELLPGMAAELVRLKVDVIVTHAGLPPVAAKRATSTIPIVIAAAADPVGQGLVASLARPGGNVTGLSMQSTDSAGKRLQLLREILPKAKRVGILARGDTPATTLLVEQVTQAAKPLNIALVVQQVKEAREFPGAFAAMQRGRAQALIVQQSPFTNTNRERIVELAAQHRLPAMFEARSFPDAGGLLSFGPSLPDLFRRAAFYVDKIFKGAKPADLPIEQPTKFELVINMKTAKALGLTIPQALLLQADEVIR